jgi:hypothetical protein
MHRIRAALLHRRGQSLRAWCHALAADGEDQQRLYDLARRTIERRLARGLPPLGEGGQRITDALRADLGPDLIPPAAPPAADTPRRRAA